MPADTPDPAPTLTRQGTSEEIRTINHTNKVALMKKIGHKFHAALHGDGGAGGAGAEGGGRKDLSGVTSLADAFRRFGFAHDDTVRTHDRVRIYQQVARDMKRKLADLRHQRYHLAARDLQRVLDGIRDEYDAVYRADERKRQREERKKLDKAMRIIRDRYDASADVLREQMVRERAAKNHELDSLQEAQRKNLEHHIRRLPKPKRRASTRMLALQQAEEHLSKNKQYVEAQHVKGMIGKLEPVEKRKFKREYQMTLHHMRERLQERQAFMRRRLNEDVDGMEWALARKMREDHQRLQRRLCNNVETMQHAHKLRSFLEPQRTAKPAHPVRRHYLDSDAYYRGQHQLQATVGHRHNHLPSLCDLHDFNAPAQSGTFEVGEAEFRRGGGGGGGGAGGSNRDGGGSGFRSVDHQVSGRLSS